MPKIKTNLLYDLADILDASPNFEGDANDYYGFDAESKTGFTMAAFFHECGTPACMAGHFADMIKMNDHNGSLVDLFSSVTNVPYAEARALCIPVIGEWETKDPWNVTAQEAAKVVRNLAETGKVDWTIVCGKMVEAD